MTPTEIRERAAALVKKHGVENCTTALDEFIFRGMLNKNPAIKDAYTEACRIELILEDAKKRTVILLHHAALLAAREDERERCAKAVEVMSPWIKKGVREEIVRSICNPPAPVKEDPPIANLEAWNQEHEREWAQNDPTTPEEVTDAE